jgi:hypothetical protein
MKLMLVSAFLFAACGDNIQPDEDQLAGAANDEAATPADPAATVSGGLATLPYDCVDHSLLFEVEASNANGRLENPICSVQFADGSVVDSCSFTHSVSPAGESFVVTVIDPATGATDSFLAFRTGPAFDPVLEVSAGDMYIGWNVNAPQGIDLARIDIDPSQNVSWQDPMQQEDPFGVVQVTQAGTYTVTAYAVYNFEGFFTCSATLQKTVEVACSGGDHAQ